jgi:putative colanic acid biosynthesis UDP-glucose lipid carrier transferase
VQNANEKPMIITNQIELSPMVEMDETPFRRYIDEKTSFFLLKRVSDIIFSVTIIVLLLSWIVPLMAIVIKLNSRGPVFFIQRRVGRGLRSFRCIKFRTMFLNCDADKCSASNNDQRVTSVGKFLRKTSLDELPQFINVLLGDMSIIGPRPHMFADCNRFSEYIQDYKFRNMVRPGITGLAQVKGFRGPAEDSYNIITRFYYDSVYIQKINFRLDVKILLHTIFQVFTIIFFKHIIKKGKAKNINSDSSKIAA